MRARALAQIALVLYHQGMSAPTDIAVFTDLDGTLLDHETYGYAPAKPLLAELVGRGIPVVLTSSKTPAELLALRAEMGLEASPAICENGAGVLPPGAETLPDRTAWQQLRATLDEFDPALRAGFRGFGDMTLEELCQATGLALEAAALARTRAFTEPGLWLGSEEDRAAFVSALAARGITAREGGRFLTLGPPTTKADTMARVARSLGARRTIALGDAPNDVEMLEAASRGVVVPNPHRAPLPPLKGEDSGRIIRANTPGPAGWSRALRQVLSEMAPETKGDARG